MEFDEEEEELATESNSAERDAFADSVAESELASDDVDASKFLLSLGSVAEWLVDPGVSK